MLIPRLACTTGASALIFALLPVASFQFPVSSNRFPATGSRQQATDAQPLRPTVHAALPQNIDDYWFAPRAAERAAPRNTALADAASAYQRGDFTAALGSARQAIAAGGPLRPYAYFYAGQSHLRLNNAADADRAFDAVLDAKPEGYLSVAAAMGRAEAAALRGDVAAAANLYQELSSHKSIMPEDVLARLARAAQAAGDRKRAAEAWLRVYYEFPLTEAAKEAALALPSFQDLIERTDHKLDLGRALILFGARRYSEAKSALQDIRARVSGDDREVVDLRIAESDYFLKRYAAARDGVRPYLENAARRAEARFFYLGAVRGLGDHDQANALTRALVDEFPDSSWSSDALNNLGTHYILVNEDDRAAQTFKELFEKFPAGPYAERSAWKYGWRAYTTGNYAETARVFEAAAAAFPRSDYRPPYLYWSARAREKLGQREASQSRLRLVQTDYLNSYYGRLATRRLPSSRADAALRPVALQTPQGPAPAPAPPPTAATIRILLASGLYDIALEELRFAQKAWSTSPAVEATMAWIYHQKGELRRAITVMRRAYPQFLAEGGESLPSQILQVIFPLTYWDSIKRNAALHDLDPYVVAALILQESTFDPGVRSVANAWGLMQIVPSTGRRLAAAVGVRGFRTSMLTNGDVNIRLGTLYFERLITKMGGVSYALASYNAGDSRVLRWKAERPGMDEDEFIDDIPFPETQNYVKRVLGIAEDYRRLYGDGDGQPRPVAKPSPTRKSTASSAKKTTKKTPAKKTTTKKKTTTSKTKGGR